LDRPPTDVDACDTVRVPLEAAAYATEVSPAPPILTTDMSASWACLACVSGWNLDQSYSEFGGLVGERIASVFGDPHQPVKSFFGSLLGVAAIVEIWSLSHWLYEGVAPTVTFGSVSSDLEMNLAYANSWLFPALIAAAWVSPIWIYILYSVFTRIVARPPPSKTLISTTHLGSSERTRTGSTTTRSSE
jgi:hypothetical protein